MDNIINGKDNNTIPHEFGHTAGLLHPDNVATFFDGFIPWNPDSQYRNKEERSKDPHNIMYSGESGLINDKTSVKIQRSQTNKIFHLYLTKQLNND